MIRSRLGLKALGLCVFAIGLMAFGMAGVAQAEETGGKWTYLDAKGVLKTFDANLEPKVELSFENGTASLLFTTGGGTKVTILCTAAEFDEGGELGPEGSLKGEILLGRIKFLGCVTLLNGTLSKPCEPHNGAEKGVILTLKGLGLILLHKLADGTKDPTVLLESDPPGKTLVHIELSEECSIGEQVPVTGDLVIWDCQGVNSFKEHKVIHLIEEFPKLHNLVALGQPALIDGSANVFLAGNHLNVKWAGLAK